MESKVKVWIARDECGAIFMHLEKPHKITDNVTGEVLGEWVSSSYGAFSKEFSSIKWEDDEPTEAYITLAEPQPKPKQEIDWEQRRYEIVKDISAAIYSRPTVKTALVNVYQIISAADTIIKELKKQSK